jgi:hypothetical protein
MPEVSTRTVYLLGAGFSKPAGMPLATEVIDLLLKQRDRDRIAGMNSGPAQGDFRTPRLQ